MLTGEPSVSGDVATNATARGEAAASASAAAAIVGGSNSGEDDKSRVLDEADRAFGGNRWPRQETLALLKIRSDMDVAFRDASVKGPLWEEVSRKLAELGYNRSAKKCKEKFENVYKYHKRTKDGRTSKGQGKTYRFFDQLEAFESHPSFPSPSPSPSPSPLPKPRAPALASAATAPASMPAANPPSVSHSISTIPSTTHMAAQNTIPATIITIPSFPSTNPTNLPPQQATNPTNYPSQSNNPSSFHNIPSDLLSNSTSSSTSSDLELEGGGKRKRKWKDFFERLMEEVIEKQEELQKKFLEAIEKREHERMAREEAWRMQEMSRINREREILAQERSMAAAKDAAVMAFLQRIAEQQNPGGQVVQNTNNPPPITQAPPAAPPPLSQGPSLPPQPLPSAPAPALAPAPAPAPALQPQPQPQPLSQQVISLDTMKTDNGDRNNNFMGASSSRWPKVEVEALIKLRTSLDSKYQENGPKGPLWEEISSRMKKLGYNRSSKRCKEKWENINKYFKKVKESNKKRPEDSKTCPYFQQLDALYKKKHKLDSSSDQFFKPENSVPIMVRPEQQWPPPQPDHGHLQDSAMEEVESDQNVDEDYKDGDDEDDDEVGGFEIVPNKQVQVNTMDANE